MVFLVRIVRIDFYDERSRLPSDEESEVTVADVAVKILELNKPILEFGHEPCEQVRRCFFIISLSVCTAC